MAVLRLRFCVRAFSSCGKRGPLFIVVRGPLIIAASLVAEHRLQTRRLSSCGSGAQLLRGMWDLPRPGLEPVSPALAGRFSTTAPPGKPGFSFFIPSDNLCLSLGLFRPLAFNIIIHVVGFKSTMFIFVFYLLICPVSFFFFFCFLLGQQNIFYDFTLFSFLLISRTSLFCDFSGCFTTRVYILNLAQSTFKGYYTILSVGSGPQALFLP